MNPIDKANTAQRLNDNPDFRDVMDWLEADIFDAFQKTAIGDSEALSRVHSLSHGFKLLKSRIAKYIELGNFEVAKIDADNAEFH